MAATTKERVTIIGSGNWGSAIATVIGPNAEQHDLFEDEVRMWVFEEQVDGRNLSEIINEDHENVKYLPGVALPENVVAITDLPESVAGATILVFVLPHQFVPRICSQITGALGDNVKAVSLIKGFSYDEETGITLMSSLISTTLGIPCGVLCGANIASEVAARDFCESTLGVPEASLGDSLLPLFYTKDFRVSVVEDTQGVEICGGIKNVIALAAGMSDGLGAGNSTKAALIRIGFHELLKFAHRYFEGVRNETFLESCGFADIIATCYGGRNRKCAEAFARASGTKSWNTIEAELLNGQRLQGTLTLQEITAHITKMGDTQEFPFFDHIYQIAFNGSPVDTLCDLPTSSL